jgi:hypothetical protein
LGNDCGDGIAAIWGWNKWTKDGQIAHALTLAQDPSHVNFARLSGASFLLLTDVISNSNFFQQFHFRRK